MRDQGDTLTSQCTEYNKHAKYRLETSDLMSESIDEPEGEVDFSD